jgi:hypothetical protein
MKKANEVHLVKGALSAKDNNELATILQGKAQDAAKATPKAKPEAVDKGLHGLCVKMVQAEGKFDMAQNAVYASFKAYAIAALPLIERYAAHAAALVDIKTTYGAARVPAAIQRITMLNNIRTIAWGKAASRNTPAQPAQGAQVVLEALEACGSLPALKTALTLLKTATHGATGVAKVTANGAKAKAAAKVAPVKAEDVVIPGTREEAIKAACRILEMVSTTFLTISEDSATIAKVAEVVKMLRAA